MHSAINLIIVEETGLTHGRHRVRGNDRIQLQIIGYALPAGLGIADEIKIVLVAVSLDEAHVDVVIHQQAIDDRHIPADHEGAHHVQTAVDPVRHLFRHKGGRLCA